jgi:uncharacterized cupin superfamily protein
MWNASQPASVVMSEGGTMHGAKVTMNDRGPAVRTIRFDAAAQGDAKQKTTTVDLHSDPTRTFRCGFWSANPGVNPISYAKDELCVLLEGTVRLTNTDGEVASYSAGDTFVVPFGFRGTWENVGVVRKFFAVYKRES